MTPETGIAEPFAVTQNNILRAHPLSDIFTVFTEEADRLHAHVQLEAQDTCADTYPLDQGFVMQGLSNLPVSVSLALSIQLRKSEIEATPHETMLTGPCLVYAQLTSRADPLNLWKMHYAHMYACAYDNLESITLVCYEIRKILQSVIGAVYREFQPA